MTIAHVASQNAGAPGNSTTSVALAYPGNVTAGNLLTIVGLKFTNSNDAYISGDLTQTAGTATIGAISFDISRNQVQNDGTAWANVGIWSVIVTGSGSLTFTLGGAPAGSFLLIAIDEFSGSWDASRLETSNSNGASLTAAAGLQNADSGSVTSAGAALMIAGLQFNSSTAATIVDDASFTSIYKNETGTDDNGTAIRQIVGSGTTETANWTFTPTGGGTTNAWAGVIAVYKEAAGSAPTINTQPQSVTVYAGQTANFSISATTSGGSLSYQWKQGVTNVGTNSSSLALVTALADNGTSITCAVTDSNGTTTSSAAILTVLPSAKIGWITA